MAVIGGGVQRGSSLGSGWVGQYFYSDYNNRRLYALEFTSDGSG